jgi:hypothetical protein
MGRFGGMNSSCRWVAWTGRRSWLHGRIEGCLVGWSAPSNTAVDLLPQKYITGVLSFFLVSALVFGARNGLIIVIIIIIIIIGSK